MLTNPWFGFRRPVYLLRPTDAQSRVKTVSFAQSVGLETRYE